MSSWPDAEFIRIHPGFRLIEYARLTVADTGTGMDTHTLERIYEPFFTTKPAGKGTGLGLSVVHGIVQAHDGIILVNSQPGEGTTFSVHFPAQTSDVVLMQSIPEDVARGRNQHILLVDDETTLTITLGRLLKRLNYQVSSSISPREAFGLFQQNPGQFDLLITDLNMPEMNGVELARRIQVLRPGLPVLLMSGFNANLTCRELTDAGIAKVLDKPAAPSAIAGALQHLLNPNSEAKERVSLWQGLTT